MNIFIYKYIWKRYRKLRDVELNLHVHVLFVIVFSSSGHFLVDFPYVQIATFEITWLFSSSTIGTN